MIAANIFDVKRFGITDGAGIRTVLFAKGCPLRCKWCQNPEGLTSDLKVWQAPASCVGCRCCQVACGQKAIHFDAHGLALDTALCNLCGDCIRACPTGAMRFDGRTMTVPQAIDEIEKDRIFYGEGGGVTLSGGECTASPEFSLALLGECRERGIDTAIETCLHTPAEQLDAFAGLSNRIIADLKLIDSARHLAHTGVDNALILKNLCRLAQKGSDLLLRIPLIPGYTADRENLAGIAAFAASLDAGVPVELLNFNPMCREKYRALRRDWAFPHGQRAFSLEEMQAFRRIVAEYGLKVL